LDTVLGCVTVARNSSWYSLAWGFQASVAVEAVVPVTRNPSGTVGGWV